MGGIRSKSTGANRKHRTCGIMQYLQVPKSTMHLDAPAASSSSEAKHPIERKITLLGLNKQPLFERLCDAVERHERHVQYQDVFYLYTTVDGNEETIELTKVGTEHTGAREMAIRKAEGVIISYATHYPETFNELENVVEDFKMRKHGKFPPIILFANEDEVINSVDEETADQTSSASEGYESSSETDSSGSIKRRPSMENIRRSHETESPITHEQGENFAKLLGDQCQFVSAPLSQYDGLSELLADLLRKLNTQRSTRRRSTYVEGLKQILPFTKSRKSTSERSDDESSSSSSSTAGDQSPAQESPVSRTPETTDLPPMEIPPIHIEDHDSITTFPVSKSTSPVPSPSSNSPKKNVRSIFRRNQTVSPDDPISSDLRTTNTSHVCSIM
ncbi:hypothetical protein M3Y94_00752000 [Aphelenchoides besseyi]|nr:hypothetical protein M3Y94_00752000 [Aphelenchoides besseyi]KAI6232082.1 hypothetical protein M3Y95_00449400 [Aphelenchoides besseyi]